MYIALELAKPLGFVECKNRLCWHRESEKLATSASISIFTMIETKREREKVRVSKSDRYWHLIENLWIQNFVFYFFRLLHSLLWLENTTIRGDRNMHRKENTKRSVLSTSYTIRFNSFGCRYIFYKRRGGSKKEQNKLKILDG